MAHNLHLSATDLEDDQTIPEMIIEGKQVSYLSVIGFLMYLMLGTHLDITYTIGTLSRFSAKPKLTHWKNGYSGTSKPPRTWNSDSTEWSFPRTWIYMVTLMLAGPRIQTTHFPPLALYSLATAEPFPGLVSYRAWLHFPLRNRSTLDLAMLGNTSLGSGPSSRRLDIRRGSHRVVL